MSWYLRAKLSISFIPPKIHQARPHANRNGTRTDSYLRISGRAARSLRWVNMPETARINAPMNAAFTSGISPG